MSLIAITAVRTLPDRGIDLPPRDRFVLYALADYADDRLLAWPSYSTLAAWTGYARSTIVASLDELERRGLVRVEQRRRDDGSYSSRRYELVFARPGGVPTAGTPPVREPDGVYREPDGGCTDSRTGGVPTAGPQEPPREPPEEPPPPPARAASPGKEQEEGLRASTETPATIRDAVGVIADARAWTPHQTTAVLTRLEQLDESTGDDLVLDLLVELLAELDRVRSPVAWIESAVRARSNSSSSPDSIDLDTIFGIAS